eukprot:6453558-Pyramimonas_sp.AAC.1
MATFRAKRSLPFALFLLVLAALLTLKVATLKDNSCIILVTRTSGLCLSPSASGEICGALNPSASSTG